MKRLAMLLVVAACSDPTAPPAEIKAEDVAEQRPACFTFEGFSWCPSRERGIPDVRR